MPATPESDAASGDPPQPRVSPGGCPFVSGFMHKVSTAWGYLGWFCEGKACFKDYPQLWIKVGTGVTRGVEMLNHAGLGLDAPSEVCDLIEQAAPLRHELPDLAIGVHHGCVVTPTEGLTDLG